jgi:hypothetical protein
LPGDTIPDRNWRVVIQDDGMHHLEVEAMRPGGWYAVFVERNMAGCRAGLARLGITPPDHAEQEMTR